MKEEVPLSLNLMVSSPCVGNGLPADRRDELDGELLLLRIDVALVCSGTTDKQSNIWILPLS